MKNINRLLLYFLLTPLSAYFVSCSNNNIVSENIDFSGLSRNEIRETFNNNDYLEYLNYSFFAFKDKNVVVEYDDNNKVCICESYNKPSLTTESINGIANQDTVFDVVSKIGLPSWEGVYSQEDASLDFAKSENIMCRVSFNKSSSSLLVNDVEILDKNNPSSWFDEKKVDLPTIDNALTIKEGMSIDDVVTVLGKPQRDIGSGAIIFEFDLFENKKIDIWMVNNSDLENTFQSDNATIVYGTHYLYVVETKIIGRDTN